MNAFENLRQYYMMKAYGTAGHPIATSREDSNHVVDETEIVHLNKNSKTDEAVKTAKDHGFDPNSPEGQEKIREILEGISKKDSDTRQAQSMQKGRPRLYQGGGMPASMHNRGGYASSKPEIYAVARARRNKKNPSMAGDSRNEMGSDWGVGLSAKSHGTEEDILFREEAEAVEEEIAGKRRKKRKTAEKAIMNMEKAHVSPQLARLLAAAAGWALSGDVAGKVDPHLANEWERATSKREKMELQEEMMRQMHRMHKKPQSTKLMIIQRKSDDGNFLDNAPAMHKLAMFYKEDDAELSDSEFFARYGGNSEDVPYDDTDDILDPQWEAAAKEGAEHSFAGESGWGGREPMQDDFHPDTGEQVSNHGLGAHNVQDWAKGVQEQTGVPLVGGPTGKEPHDDIYKHYGIEGGHMSQKPITAQHIADYVQNKTGQSVSLPGTPNSSVQQMIKQFLLKDHAPLPPRYGLLWDAVKHRWTRPEKVGRTVWEVQGHKRFRGTGAGAHERSRKTGGSGGYGVGSSEAGRRFRSTGDIGRAHPHEAKHPGQRTLQRLKRATQPKRR